ncbi:arginine kinase Met e 2 [Macrobrachium rosenbergii]|uniref:arginine kinase Met e 2 n=1 Tax=Macrobrachium rosenbergii TaxID=79674 RepID=UPI0034D5BFED
MGLACCKDKPSVTNPQRPISSSFSGSKKKTAADPVQRQPTPSAKPEGPVPVQATSSAVPVAKPRNLSTGPPSDKKDEIDHHQSEPELKNEVAKEVEDETLQQGEVHQSSEPQEEPHSEVPPEPTTTEDDSQKSEPEEEVGTAQEEEAHSTEETRAEPADDESELREDSSPEDTSPVQSPSGEPDGEETKDTELALTEEQPHSTQSHVEETEEIKEEEDDVPPPLPSSPPPESDEDVVTVSDDSASKMVDAEVLEKLEASFGKLEAATDCKSLLKKYLTKEVFDDLKAKKTSLGASLLDVIQSGVENLDSGVGIYAPDAEAYTLFAPLFDPIIEDYHVGFKKEDQHPPKDFGDLDKFVNVDPEGAYVVSTRVRCGRSMEGYPFNPCLTEAQYREMEEKVSSTLSALEGELKGTYYPLTGMSKEVQQKLIDDHFLFKEGDRFLQAANACRYWPTGRGIYHNDKKTFLVWVNEEDHLRIISMQKGGDLGEVYRRLVSAVGEIEKRVPFSHHDRLGFLTFCPTNLGTTVRASVHIKLPKLAANKTKLEEVAAKYNLQVRGTRGEHTEAEGGIYDISNKRRMGLTEYQAVKEMQDGILELIKIEKGM